MMYDAVNAATCSRAHIILYIRATNYRSFFLALLYGACLFHFSLPKRENNNKKKRERKTASIFHLHDISVARSRRLVLICHSAGCICIYRYVRVYLQPIAPTMRTPEYSGLDISSLDSCCATFHSRKLKRSYYYIHTARLYRIDWLTVERRKYIRSQKKIIASEFSHFFSCNESHFKHNEIITS